MQCTRCAPADRTPVPSSWLRAQIAGFACGTWPTLSIHKWWRERRQTIWTMLFYSTSMKLSWTLELCPLDVQMQSSRKSKFTCLQQSSLCIQMKATELYFHVLVYYTVQGCSNFQVCGWISIMWPLKWKLSSRTFMWCCLFCCKR